VKVVVDKNLRLFSDTSSNRVLGLEAFRTLAAIGLSTQSGNLNVIDFGGGGGYNYKLAKIAFGGEKTLKWHVVETPEMVSEAIRIKEADLRFYEDITDAKNDLVNVDLVFSSSALQYCPDPLYFLKELVKIDAKYLFITRTPFVDSTENIIAIQKSSLSSNGPGPLPEGIKDRSVFYPITYVSRSAVEDILGKYYEIRFMTDEGSGVFSTKGLTVNMNGYFCVRKDLVIDLV
jgi:putative methyltransferase (TIGR04325 family)